MTAELRAIVMPDLGAGQVTIRVSTWLVTLGESLDEGDRIVELLVPGMTFDVAAPASGRLAHIDKFADAEVRAGDVLGWIEPSADLEISN